MTQKQNALLNVDKVDKFFIGKDSINTSSLWATIGEDDYCISIAPKDKIEILFEELHNKLESKNECYTYGWR